MFNLLLFGTLKKKKLSLREFQSWQILDPRERLQSVPSVITFLASSREGEKRREAMKKGRGTRKQIRVVHLPFTTN